MATLAERTVLAAFPGREGVDDQERLAYADRAMAAGREQTCRSLLEHLEASAPSDPWVRDGLRERLSSRLSMVLAGLRSQARAGGIGPVRAFSALERAFFFTLQVDEQAALTIVRGGLPVCRPKLAAGFEENWPSERQAALRWAQVCAEVGGLLPDDVVDDSFLGSRNQLQDLCTGELGASLTDFVRDSGLVGYQLERAQSRLLGYPVGLEERPDSLNALSGVLAHCEAVRDDFTDGWPGWELSLGVDRKLIGDLCTRLSARGVPFQVSAHRSSDDAPQMLQITTGLVLDGFPTRLVVQSTRRGAAKDDEQLREQVAMETGVAIEEIAVEQSRHQEICVRPFDPAGEDLAVDSRRGLAGHWRCDHERGFWSAVGTTSAALGCHACGCERLVVVPRHRLPADHPLAPADDSGYPALCRALSIMAGGDPANVPCSVAAMRQADGVVPIDPGAYAIGAPTRHLGQGRRVDDISPRRHARA